MEPVLRPARPDDKAAIAAFTRDTFSWGDYVGERLDEWLAAPDSMTVVAEAGGEAVAIARGALLSPTEAWSQGLRVHPDHRRRGLGTALLEHLATWAGAAGARVMRLSAETGNGPALSLFPGLGFRPIGDWLEAERPVASGKPVPGGNGGKRVPALERLTPAPPYEADAAMLAWAGGPLERAAHGLFTAHWSCRRLTVDDLQAAARRRALWQARSGWAIAESDEGVLRVPWLCTYPEDCRVFLRALRDLAAGAEAERIEMPVPEVDWLCSALEQAGWELFPLRVFARAL